MNKQEKLLERFKANVEAVGDLNKQQDVIKSLGEMVKNKINFEGSTTFCCFVEAFFAYKLDVEKDMQYTLKILNSGALKTNLLLRLRYKCLLRKLVKTFRYLCEFHVEFYSVFGLSLTQAKEKMDQKKI